MLITLSFCSWGSWSCSTRFYSLVLGACWEPNRKDPASAKPFGMVLWMFVESRGSTAWKGQKNHQLQTKGLEEHAFPLFSRWGAGSKAFSYLRAVQTLPVTLQCSKCSKEGWGYHWGFGERAHTAREGLHWSHHRRTACGQRVPPTRWVTRRWWSLWTCGASVRWGCLRHASDIFRSRFLC